MTSDVVKGFKDYTGDEAEKRAEVKKIIEGAFAKYGFEPAETPIIEYAQFVRGENKQDEAVSDIFQLQDKGKRELALRYEFTFQLKRLMKNKKLPYKRYQIGPVFRDEPVSSNRLRQFVQCDVDTIGADVKDEAEILALANELLTGIDVEPIILVGNRALLNEILEDNGVKDKDKLQVLREIDKYDKIGEKQLLDNLKKLGAEKVLDNLKKGEKYFSKFNSYKDVIELIKYCKMYGVKVLFSPTVVRGLSYYNGNVFEIKAKGVKGNENISSNSPKRGIIKETLVAGGSYMFDGIQCTGISFGLDRLAVLSPWESAKLRTLVISLEQDKESIKLADKFRSQGQIVSIYYGKPSKALEYANSYGYERVIFIGKEEIKKHKYKIKVMKTGRETWEKL